MPYAESDRLVTVFSKDMGKKNLLAKSACKPGSKLCGFTDSLSILNYAPKATKSFTLITQPKLVSPLFNVKKMGASFSRAYSMCELIARASEFDDKMPEIYYALKNSLIIMDLMASDDAAMADKILMKFELFFLDYAGFAMNFDNCCHCGKSIGDNPSYDSFAGGAICSKCAIGRPGIIESGAAAEFVKKLSMESDLEKIIKSVSPMHLIGEAAALIKSHIQSNLNVTLNSGRIIM